jgi:hypothetical protein
MAQTLREVLARRLEEQFVGRRHELDALLSCLQDGGPVALHLHGIAGIGKTALLRRFAQEAELRGATVISLDCRDIEPTQRGLLDQIGVAVGGLSLDLEDMPDRLVAKNGLTVLILDDYHHVFLADTWVRQELAPALPSGVRLVMSSREPPLPGWLSSEWQGLFQSLTLRPLSQEEAGELMSRAKIGVKPAQRIYRLTRGHPLALRLAMASLGRNDNMAAVEEFAFQAVIQGLADLHLSQIADRELREALEAASVLRRPTVPLLAALLPGSDAFELYERMRALPFVEAAHDGLLLHSAVQEAIAASLRAFDPERYRRYRQSAWRGLRSQVRRAGITEMWRYTADMLYIVDNAYIREAFFPSSLDPISAEPAQPDDWESIKVIAARHETPASQALLAHWWQSAPRLFQVMRNSSGNIQGFSLVFEPRLVDGAVMDKDPLAQACRRHLRQQPIGRDETAIFARRWLDADVGELPSAVQTRCWLGVKQSYMGLRPHLRRCYISVSDLQTYGPVAASLGFNLVEGASALLDEKEQHLAVLDMGPGSVEGWLAAHVAREIGLDEAGILDLKSRELVGDGARVRLTPLEFEFMRYLVAHEGEAVSRATLLESVWGYDFSGESNVVDTLVTGLRRKLGTSSRLIETVWGTGYRFRSPDFLEGIGPSPAAG